MEEKKKIQRWKAKPIKSVKKIDSKLKEKTAEEIIKKPIKKTTKKPTKKPVKKEPKKIWAPVKINYATLQKLKICFAVWMTDEEACYFCQISTSTLYNFQKENPDFLEEKDILKKNINLQAKLNIWTAIKNKSVADSWKRLEKKDPEFSNKTKIDLNFQWELTEEDKEMYNLILEKNKKLLIWNKETKK